jgi:hypothetical protein
MYKHLFLVGLAIWVSASAYLRFDGQRLLRPKPWWGTLLLFVISFLLMAVLARRLCNRFQVPRERWPSAAISLALPTLLLDPFSSAFFSAAFPNIAPEMSGVFGGWMLCCCAGALLGVMVGQPRSARP